MGQSANPMEAEAHRSVKRDRACEPDIRRREHLEPQDDGVHLGSGVEGAGWQVDQRADARARLHLHGEGAAGRVL